MGFLRAVTVLLGHQVAATPLVSPFLQNLTIGGQGSSNDTDPVDDYGIIGPRQATKGKDFLDPPGPHLQMPPVYERLRPDFKTIPEKYRHYFEAVYYRSMVRKGPYHSTDPTSAIFNENLDNMMMTTARTIARTKTHRNEVSPALRECFQGIMQLSKNENEIFDWSWGEWYAASKHLGSPKAFYEQSEYRHLKPYNAPRDNPNDPKSDKGWDFPQTPYDIRPGGWKKMWKWHDETNKDAYPRSEEMSDWIWDVISQTPITSMQRTEVLVAIQENYDGILVEIARDITSRGLISAPNSLGSFGAEFAQRAYNAIVKTLKAEENMGPPKMTLNQFLEAGVTFSDKVFYDRYPDLFKGTRWNNQGKDMYKMKGNIDPDPLTGPTPPADLMQNPPIEFIGGMNQPLPATPPPSVGVGAPGPSNPASSLFDLPYHIPDFFDFSGKEGGMVAPTARGLEIKTRGRVEDNLPDPNLHVLPDTLPSLWPQPARPAIKRPDPSAPPAQIKRVSFDPVPQVCTVPSRCYLDICALKCEKAIESVGHWAKHIMAWQQPVFWGLSIMGIALGLGLGLGLGFGLHHDDDDDDDDDHDNENNHPQKKAEAQAQQVEKVLWRLNNRPDEVKEMFEQLPNKENLTSAWEYHGLMTAAGAQQMWEMYPPKYHDTIKTLWGREVLFQTLTSDWALQRTTNSYKAQIGDQIWAATSEMADMVHGGPTGETYRYLFAQDTVRTLNAIVTWSPDRDNTTGYAGLEESLSELAASVGIEDRENLLSKANPTFVDNYWAMRQETYDKSGDMNVRRKMTEIVKIYCRGDGGPMLQFGYGPGCLDLNGPQKGAPTLTSSSSTPVATSTESSSTSESSTTVPTTTSFNATTSTESSSTSIETSTTVSSSLNSTTTVSSTTQSSSSDTTAF
ncbi:hypothetical protein F5Y15DRAFT_414230, partial [Xylariaceae sp. FL0016]